MLEILTQPLSFIANVPMLLLQIPGLEEKIPGVPLEYLPQAGQFQATKIHNEFYTDAFALFGLLVVVGLVVAGAGLGKYVTTSQVLMAALLTACLLVTHHKIFEWTMQAGFLLGTRVFSENDMRSLNQEFREAAEELRRAEESGNNETPGTPRVGRWYRRILAVAFMTTPATALLTELVMALATIIFYATAIVMNLLWRVLVTILWVFSPIAIAFNAVPRWGSRITAAWFTSLVQVSAWQIWFALCALFVRSSDNFFQMYVDAATGGTPDAADHVESVGIALVFTVMYVATPVMVNLLFPFSKFSAGAQLGMMQAVNNLTTVASTIAKTGKAFSRMGGGMGGGGK